MTDVEKRTAAVRFAADWKGRGDEKQETQAFWLALLQKVYGVDEPEKDIAFELPVKLDLPRTLAFSETGVCSMTTCRGMNAKLAAL
jgi:hypothetical protein